jgi:acetylornithine/succinyldiaminopimelate/putrescine aminotransferase
VGLRRLCDEKKLLLIVDEVQTGIGRTGKFFCYQHFGITPDIMTLAKALGGGLPIGSMVVRDGIADTLTPGTHASTFGGSPLVCRGALAVLRAVGKEKLLSKAQTSGEYLFSKLNAFQKKYPAIKEVRGMGLMAGVDLHCPGKPVVEACLQQGLLINCTHDTVLRIMPALNVTKKEIDRAMAILDSALALLKG